MTNAGRYTAQIEEDVVLFLIGARIYHPLRFWKWLPVARAMNEMQRQMREHPEIGVLHVENFGSLNGVSVQYWKSFEHLERFARSDEWAHLPAWREFNRIYKKAGEVGVWHETYLIRAGEQESIYVNMPRFGLARAGDQIEVGAASTAARRVGRRANDVAPVPES